MHLRPPARPALATHARLLPSLYGYTRPCPFQNRPMRARRDTQSTAQGLEQIEKIWAERESLDNLRLLLDQPPHIIMLNPAMGVRLHEKMLCPKLFPLDHRTTASGISIRCSFRNVSESVFPSRMGRAPVSASRYKKDSTRCRGRGKGTRGGDETLHRETTISRYGEGRKASQEATAGYYVRGTSTQVRPALRDQCPR